MNVYSIPTTLRIQPNQPVELAFNVDGETIRVPIEWAVIERWLGELRASDPEAVREAINQRRTHRARRAVARLRTWRADVG